ncbi:hypothetical protein NMY22_g10885 [Coprinellus aureogranulatus]|nr:hypothetical protein NMY22_g10885 [Coprinellus aureogranulatus]
MDPRYWSKAEKAIPKAIEVRIGKAAKRTLVNLPLPSVSVWMPLAMNRTNNTCPIITECDIKPTIQTFGYHDQSWLLAFSDCPRCLARPAFHLLLVTAAGCTPFVDEAEWRASEAPKMIPVGTPEEESMCLTVQSFRNEALRIFGLGTHSRGTGFAHSLIYTSLPLTPNLPIMASPHSAPSQGGSRPLQTTWLERTKSAGKVAFYHLRKHSGIGIVCAVAYFDPGNWGVDLAAGSEFGYRLLFVVLLAGLFAVFLQVLASRLGCVTGVDLATHSRLLLYNRPKHTLLWRWLGLYPLYILAEVAIVATDLAELLGSAIALCMLFPKLELWHGVLITAFDVMFVLAMGDPLRGRPVRLFEFLISAMVLAVLVCMIVVISKVDVDWADAFKGYIPSKYIFQSGGLYTSVGILGATVMPHSLFIGSALATQDRIQFRPPRKEEYFDGESSTDEVCAPTAKPSRWQIIWHSVKRNVRLAFKRPPPSFYHKATRHSERENNPYAFVTAHLYHGMADVVASLLGFAVLINSLILMLASAVFFYGDSWNGNGDPASLFDAYDLIRDIVGKRTCRYIIRDRASSIGAGKSTFSPLPSDHSLTLRAELIPDRYCRRSSRLRRIPSMAGISYYAKTDHAVIGLASQVVLSVVLPFITFPLLWCTSSKAIMSVRKTKQTSSSSPVVESDPLPPSPSTAKGDATSPALSLPSLPQSSPPSAPPSVGKPPHSPSAVEAAEEDEMVDYSNNKLAIVVGAVIWLVVVAANVYVLVDLGMQAAA